MGYNAGADNGSIFIRLTCCLANLWNPAKFSENSNSVRIQSHPRSSILVSIESA